ncbi:hypothetical protein [Angustibacter aerolatus]
MTSTALGSGSGRLLRAGAGSLCAVGLSLVAHLAGGGSAPGWLPLLALVALVTTAATLLAGRRRGLVAIAAALGGAQVALHTAFTRLAATGGCPPVETTHLHAGALDGCAPAMESMHGGRAMLLAHALATLVIALVLAVGERALWLLAAWTVPALPGAPRLPATGGAARRRDTAVLLPRRPVVHGGASRRGPPVPLPA